MVLSFSGTVVDLQNKFANAVTGEDNAQIEQNLEVRENWGLLRLVGGLTAPSGPGTSISLTSNMLMEEDTRSTCARSSCRTMVDRYVILEVIPGAERTVRRLRTTPTRSGSLSASGNDGVSFTTLMAPPVGAR